MSRNPYYDGPVSGHFDGARFRNPQGEAPRGFADLLRWQFSGGRKRWPPAWPSPHPPARPDSRVDGTALRLTMVGHATLLIQTAGLNILTDPVWSERASPLSFAGPKRVNPPGVAFDDLPPIDIVLLTHNHYDHLDLATLRRLHAAFDPLVITPLGNDAIVRRAAPAMRFAVGDWGARIVAGAIAAHLEPAHHWSARGTRDRSMALWSAFVLETPGGRIYHVGDTGFHEGRFHRAVNEKHGDLRLAILPIGAYEPRWFMAGQHQNPEEAVRAMALCGARTAAGHHWATFRLTDEAIDEPRAHLIEALDHAGVGRGRFRPLLPGEVWDVPA